MNLDQFILDSNGKFVSVDFIKKDGSLRTITGRLGVKAPLKGGKSTLDPNEYITIYSLADEGYRAINRKTIQAVSVNGLRIINKKGV